MRQVLAIAAATTLCFFTLIVVPAHAARAHVVLRGETLMRIAQRYGVSMNELVQVNRLKDPAHLRVGQVLAIPIPTHESSRQVRKNSARPSSRGQSSNTMSTYTVRSGDNLSSISRHFGVSVPALIRANALASDRLQIGQQLQIPGTASAPRPRVTLQRPSPALVQPMLRAARTSPEPPLSLVVGAELRAPRPMRMRSGPKTYYPMTAIIAADTPLRIIGEDAGWYQVQLADDEGWVRDEDFRMSDPGVAHPVGRAELVAEALRYLGTPYVWGGGSSGGVDCSGFVYVVFSHYLPNLGRLSTFDYFHVGTPIDRSGLQPGDLVFFTTYAPGPSHVGIYLGDGRFIHASSASHQVTTSLLDDPYYVSHFFGARRLLGP